MPLDSCLFCQIVAGKIPCHQVWSDTHHMAFLSIFPNTRGVTVVIPKEHYSSYAFAQDDHVLTGLIIATKKVARLLDASFDDVDRCGLVLEGFGVDHLHSKLYPLHGTKHDGPWKPLESGHITTFFETYPGYIASNDSARADDAELAELAAHIRRQADLNSN